MEERIKAVEAQVKPLLESAFTENRLCGFNALAGAIGVKAGHVFYTVDVGTKIEGLFIYTNEVTSVDVAHNRIKYEYRCKDDGIESYFIINKHLICCETFLTVPEAIERYKLMTAEWQDQKRALIDDLNWQIKATKEEIERLGIEAEAYLKDFKPLI